MQGFFDWFARNQEVITWVVRGVGALLLLALRFYFSNGRDIQKALAAALELLKGEINDIVTGPGGFEAIRTVTDAVYDQYLAGTVVARFVSKGSFYQIVLEAWQLLMRADMEAKAGLARAGYPVNLG